MLQNVQNDSCGNGSLSMVEVWKVLLDSIKVTNKSMASEWHADQQLLLQSILKDRILSYKSRSIEAIESCLFKQKTILLTVIVAQRRERRWASLDDERENGRREEVE